MKKFHIAVALVLSSVVAFAQNPKNNKADSIIGKYYIEASKAKIEFTKNPADGYLQVSGKVLGIGETHKWKPISE